MPKFYKYTIYSLLIFPALVFFTDLTRNPYYFQIALLNALVLFIWSVYLLQCIFKGKIKWIANNPLELPLLSLITVAVVSFLIAYLSKQPYLIPEIIQEGKTLPKFNLDFLKASIFSEGTKKLIFTLVNLLLVYWLTSVVIRVISTTEEQLERSISNFYNVLFVVGFLAAFYAILQYFRVEPIWPKELNPFGGRPVSTFGNPNFMSSYLLMLFPIITVNFLLENSVGKKVFYLILLFVYFWAIVATLTRSTWIGLFSAGISVAVFLLIDYFNLKSKSTLMLNRNWLIFICLISILSFIFWPRSVGGYTALSRITEMHGMTKHAYGPMHQRILIWSCAFEMIKEKPVLGKGWGLFELFYPFYQGRCLFNELYRGFRTHANNAHNEILEYWSQVGTVGLAVYIWFFVTFFFYGWKLMKSNNLSYPKKFFAIAILAGTLGMFVDNIFGNVSTQFCVPAFLFWFNIGSLTLIDKTAKVVEYKLNNIAKFVLVLVTIFFVFLIYRWYNFFFGEVNYFKGFKLSKRNEVSLATKYLEQAHRYNREVNSEYELGNCYARAKRLDDAIWGYYQALAANCGYDEIHFNLATVYGQKGDLTNAIRNYTQSLFINPTSQEAYHAIGNIFLTNLDVYLDKAESLFTNAVYFYPNNIDFWNNLGYIYTRKGDNQKAVEAFRKALKLNPEFQLAKQNLRSALARAGIKSDPLLEYEDLVRQAEEKIQQQNWQEVLKISKRLVEISPNSFKSHFYFANALFTLGKLDEAIGEYCEALKISPANVPLLTNLGLAYIQKKDYENAKITFTQILQLDPQNKVAQDQLNFLRNIVK
ncbi:MAG: tetratricopeptide repeat protein [Elusimicrobiota bacterium]|nr:tetratricopeptide repeat protein [Elusimicrobiota bacterium]